MTLHYWMTPPRELPISTAPVRFAVGVPAGPSSNSWKLWISKLGDVYVMCRDSFNDSKLSLHASGKWRFAHTSSAVAEHPELMDGRGDRVWEKWTKPAAADHEAVCAFQFAFPTSELALQPAQRERWPKSIVFVEPSDDAEQMTVVSLFVAPFTDMLRSAQTELAVLANLALPQGGSAQLLAHHEPAAGTIQMIEDALVRVAQQIGDEYEKTPRSAYAYFYGHRGSGARFVAGARVWRQLD